MPNNLGYQNVILQLPRFAVALLSAFCLASAVFAQVAETVDSLQPFLLRLKISETLSQPKFDRAVPVPTGVATSTAAVVGNSGLGPRYRDVAGAGVLLLAFAWLFRRARQRRAAAADVVSKPFKAPIYSVSPAFSPSGSLTFGFLTAGVSVTTVEFSGRACRDAMTPELLPFGVTAVPTPMRLRNPKFVQRFQLYAWRPSVFNTR